MIQPMKKNTSVAIAKGIAIIAVVVGHSAPPRLLSLLVYAFHMPLFFMFAGYFFNVNYVNNEWEFIRRRFKGLYVPFVKWSLLFLLLYNVWFKLGIMNEQFGNAGGGLLHPYSFHQMLQNAVSICVNMSGYDVCMGGTFWFFRALLVASIVFLLYYKFLSRLFERFAPFTKRFELKREQSIAFIICLTALLAAFIKVTFNLKVTGLPQGGYRDIMGVFFFGVGFLYRHYEPRLGLTTVPANGNQPDTSVEPTTGENSADTRKKRTYIRTGLWLVCTAILLAWCFFALPGGMPFTTQRPANVFLSIPPAIAGTLLLHELSKRLDRKPSLLRRFLVYCGNNTLYVFVFHLAVFKLVNFLKLWYYGMDYSRMGYYPVIHEHNGDWFWLVYSIAGTAIPLLWLYGYRKLKARSTNAGKECSTNGR